MISRSVVAVLLFQLFAVVATADDAPALRVGIAMSSFSRNSPSDARIATGVFLKHAFEDHNYAYDGKVYETDGDLVRAISAGRTDLFFANAALYVDRLEKIGVRPILVAARTGEPTETLVLVANTDRNLSQLKGGTLLVDNSARGETPANWISDHLIRSGSGETAPDYFSIVETVDHSSKALLPVYFGKTDAAILSAADFETMCEHNPSVRKRLHIVCRSKALARAVLCVRKDYDSYSPNQIVGVLDGLQKSTEGTRFLERIGAQKFLPFKEEYLLYNREIHQRIASVKSARGGAK